ncbi:MAG: glycosyltransferase family 4 protein, partial [Chloroflexi bacterium]|nr:glycosyltransferase family 4 protein [Chloroflexota bacterium]
KDTIPISLICTGPQNAFYQVIEQRIAELDLHDHVSFLGIVPPEDLRGLYRAAQFLIFPSHFEGAGYPPIEAFHDGVPVASSNATSLPEVVGDAGLLFDPYSVAAIQQAVHRMATDAELREDLRNRGYQRLAIFRWDRVARTYRALYRKLAHRSLTEEDKRLLSET